MSSLRYGSCGVGEPGLPPHAPQLLTASGELHLLGRGIAVPCGRPRSNGYRDSTNRQTRKHRSPTGVSA
jgi:hypothetical protein